MATTRERLHALLEELPDDRLDEAEAAIATLTAPFRPLAEAPEDDEPLTEEDLEAIARGREAYRRGEAIPDDELLTDEDLVAIAETRAELARGETIPGDEVRREFGW